MSGPGGLAQQSASRPSWRAWRLALALGVVVYAALLRADAVIGKWGPLAGPAATREFQTTLVSIAAALRPPSLGWRPEPFLWGDPYDDLENARTMRSFYRGTYREPVFVATTRLFQSVVGDQPQAVVLASALFSTLAVAATYLVGVHLGGYWVGLAAALLLAVERDVISAGALGSRDDAFVFFLVLLAYAMIGASKAPTWRNGVLCGLAAAGACLTRITSFTVVVPAIAYLAMSRSGPPRSRWRAPAAAVAVITVAVAPLLVSCWLRYGDPLYSISRLSDWYISRGVPGGTNGGIFGFMWPLVSAMPARQVETVVVGLTAYQHQYKWLGFDPWLPGLGAMLQMLSIAGVFGMLWSRAGRVVLMIGLCGIVPFVFTWQTPSLRTIDHVRFTLASYPFLILAAVLAAASAVQCAADLGWRRAACRPGAVAAKGAAMAALIGAGWLVLNLVPWWRLQEGLSRGQDALVLAGSRDRAFFRRGWYPPLTNASGNVTARFSHGRTASMFVPTRPGRTHRLTLRVDPFVYAGAPAQRLSIAVNGALLATFPLSFNPNRIGEYTLEVPAHVVTTGQARIDLRLTYSTRVGDVREAAPLENGTAVSFSDMAGRNDEVGLLLWAVEAAPQ